MDIKKYASLAFFNGLSAEDLDALAPYFTSMRFVAGTTIFEQGERAESVYLVASGEVVIRYKPMDGPPMTVTHVQPGGIFGWSAAMGNQAYTSAAICSLDSEVLCIKGETLRNLCEKNPQVGSVLLERLFLVVAERQRHRQGNVSSILANGMRQASCSGETGEN